MVEATLTIELRDTFPIIIIIIIAHSQISPLNGISCDNDVSSSILRVT
jgi:hypothetical protein